MRAASRARFAPIGVGNELDQRHRSTSETKVDRTAGTLRRVGNQRPGHARGCASRTVSRASTRLLRESDGSSASLDADGRPLGGIELTLDSVLRGDSAMSAIARDVRGRRSILPNPGSRFRGAGSNVTLTINATLQDICERALARAVDSLDAAGGDIVVMNPNNGDVLAMASQRVGREIALNHRGDRAIRARLDIEAVHRRGVARTKACTH